MIIICHNCNSKFKVRDDIVAGGPKKARCRNCGSGMLISPPVSGMMPEEGLITRPVEPAAAAYGAQSSPQADSTAAEKKTDDAPPERESAPDAVEPDQAAASPEVSAENAMAKLEKRRREMEDEIAGRLHKAALETLEFQDLEYLGNKLKSIESNPDTAAENDIQLFACIKCKSVFALYPDDPRQCPNCPSDAVLVRGQDIMRQFGMFNR